MFSGISLKSSLAVSTAAISSSHTTAAVPAFFASSADPLPFGATKSSLSLVITTKSAEHASIAALPAHTPAITEICGTTPETDAALPIISLYALSESIVPSTNAPFES